MSGRADEVRQIARDARVAARTLASLPTAARVAALERIADALVAQQDALLAANAVDVAAAEAMVAAGELSAAAAARLVLTPKKLAALADGIRQIAAMPEPLGRRLRATELADGLELEQVTSPLGVLLVIFESRPDALPQIAALALRSGNAVLLKGGREARASNAALHRVLTEALAPEVPAAVVGLLEAREDVDALLGLDDVIDLVIPRGSNALVRSIQARTRIPVLGHADGVCHVYVDSTVDLAMAKRVVRDAKCDYPSACNAMETLLVHRSLAELDRYLAGEITHYVAVHDYYPTVAVIPLGQTIEDYSSSSGYGLLTLMPSRKWDKRVVFSVYYREPNRSSSNYSRTEKVFPCCGEEAANAKAAEVLAGFVAKQMAEEPAQRRHTDQLIQACHARGVDVPQSLIDDMRAMERQGLESRRAKAVKDLAEIDAQVAAMQQAESVQ